MKKAILISIKPEWVEKILNGEKTIILSKNMPKCELPIDVYIYCSKPNRFSNTSNGNKRQILTFDVSTNKYHLWRSSYGNVLNGKVVAKFTLNKVEKLEYQHIEEDSYQGWTMSAKFSYSDIQDKCCMEDYEIDEYLDFCNGYAWHIENLQIFDKPMELSDFYYICQRSGQCFCKDYFNRNNYHKLIGDDERGLCNKWLNVLKAPQSWKYVYVVD